jgi:cyclase
MLESRIIPCLLIKRGGLVKTIEFANPKYVGDPLNAVRIFNEKEVDELLVLDIDASKEGRAPNYGLLKELAAECRMPLCYGGGVTSVQQVEKLVSIGVEKVAIGAAFVRSPQLVIDASRCVGSQSVSVVLDVRESVRGHQVFIMNGTLNTGRSPDSLAKQAQDCGAGEIVVNSIGRDGSRRGYDMALVESLRKAVCLPLTVLGGAGAVDDIIKLVARFKPVGAAAGSLFVFKGTYRAVLISYIGSLDRRRINEASA